MEIGANKNRLAKVVKNHKFQERISRYGFFILLLVLWQVISNKIAIPLVFPTPKDTVDALINDLQSVKVMSNIGVTLVRVVKGWGLAVLFGVPIGILMGLSRIFKSIFGGIVNSIRQIPMMAWVPLSIIWLGIGDGPTLFMIALNGIFQVIMNTSSGVLGIDKDYYNAAHSMGASRWSIFKNIVLPASLPDILVGSRLAISAGWMSVV